MVYVIAQLKLESYDKWKPVFDERAIRKESGSKKLVSSVTPKTKSF